MVATESLLLPEECQCSLLKEFSVHGYLFKPLSKTPICKERRSAAHAHADAEKSMAAIIEIDASSLRPVQNHSVTSFTISELAWI